MKRANYHGIRNIIVEEVDSPEPGPLDVRVKIKYCGICGSDVHEYLHGPFAIRTWGHEACGEIVEKGSEVDSLEIGDPVLAFGPDAYAEYLTTAASRVRKLDKSISWERAAVLEPLAGAAYAIKRGGLTADDTLLITGAGPIGLSFLNAAKAVGVKTIYMTEISETRRKKAEEMGATAVFNPLEVKVPYQIKELTNKAGVDIAIEAVGVGDSLKDCLASTRYQGTVVVHGIFTERVPIHMLGFVSREVTMIGTNSIDMDQALEWAYEDKIKPETIVSNVIPLDEIEVNGFGTLVTPGNSEIKILVEP
jgi:(R,R)-butanediol dehydrogenase/meso-butanediol dehydrogenase/diacetyl reductase